MTEQIMGGAGAALQVTPDAPTTEPLSGTALEGYPIHPAASLFPMLGATEMASLAADIAARGLLNPIVLANGAVLDGRNRLVACHISRIDPRFEEWRDPGCGPTAWVISQNLHRRHLNESQRAMIADSLATLGDGVRADRQGSSIDAPTQDKAAELLKVGRAQVQRARKVREQAAPETVKAIENGEKTITAALREIKEEKREARREENRAAISGADIRQAVPTARFATITLDPPWDWGDEGDQDQLGRARPQYGTMPITDLLGLPVSEWADEDCHVYLWITNRSLPKGFWLLEAWGFRYVTCLTWVKPSFGMGNYFRGQTEQVLFGVKGSQALKRKDVGTAFHAARGKEHSSKPEAFYDLVESCSPGPYLEVFARSGRSGWVSQGAEA